MIKIKLALWGDLTICNIKPRKFHASGLNYYFFFPLHETRDCLDPGNQPRSLYEIIWTELWIRKPILEKQRWESQGKKHQHVVPPGPPPPQKKQNKKTQLQNANILQNLAAIHNLDRRQTWQQSNKNRTGNDNSVWL